MSTLFGESNVRLKNNGSYADIVLDKTTVSGLVSKNRYYHGFFNAAIKLPAGVTSGIVLAIYMSNANVFPNNHDEIDFELLGCAKRSQWVLQTNMYGNGNEEKVSLWFDPKQQFHQYTILWNHHHIVQHTYARGNPQPSGFNCVPIKADVTIYHYLGPVNYKYAPFVGSLGELEIVGCLMQKANSIKAGDGCLKNATVSSLDPVDGEEYARLSKQQMAGMNWVRKKRMAYSYCKDTTRYKVMPPMLNKSIFVIA
ncbi:hypothetical protein L1987_16845 [Smallanthus sonchifolius]|uniref:Uncharacterized protein n=2 Tax=Smallanthus sonchifolius TaxID=185202 RepID=A0ACB9IV76_9ASTR|nr:hypothetical protein L1987_16843 [Smallanthus sonchifolius]KAI3812139.1 hypothetical protein L1987_16845 [Smallanthus sonchifolius]